MKQSKMSETDGRSPIDRVFTPKQVQYLKTPDARINILMGSVRSGKTYISLVKWALRVKSTPKNTPFMMMALTSTSLSRNVLQVLLDIVGERNLTWSIAKKEAILFDHKIFLEFAPDERAEAKIRGMTLYGAYCDEITLYPESFFQMLLSRLSMKGAFMYATTNPDSPEHWVKRNYIDRQDKLDCRVFFFSIDDNTFLDPHYVKSLKAEYGGEGIFYKRFILGEWVIADGLVYSSFKRDSHVINHVPDEKIYTDYSPLIIGIDYGISNPQAYTMIGWNIKEERLEILRDYQYSGRDTHQPKTDAELYEDLKTFAKDYPIDRVYIDPSAESFSTLLKKNHDFRSYDADNKVLKGIGFVNSLFAQNKLFVDHCCENILKEIAVYAWDEERSKRTGEDCVVKESDHNLDAMRYGLVTEFYRKAKSYGIFLSSVIE